MWGCYFFWFFFAKKCYTFWIIWHIRYNRLKGRIDYSHTICREHSSRHHSPDARNAWKNGRRVAAASCGISSGGHTKKREKVFGKNFWKSVTLFKLFIILYMNKKIGKKNEDRTLSLRSQTWFDGAKIGVYTLCLRLLLLLCLKGWSSLYRWRKRRHVLYWRRAQFAGSAGQYGISDLPWQLLDFFGYLR